MKSLLSFILVVFVAFQLHAQSASVSPSRLYYNVAPGGYKTKTIRITNNGSKKEEFQVSFLGFSSNNKHGKTTLDTVQSETSCADWLTASPAFFELGPGETQNVEILLQVPNTPESNTVRWSVISVKLARENKGVGEGGDAQSAMQIVQSFQFLIHVFQTPPNITYKEASILSFQYDSLSQDSVKRFQMELQNTGDAILDCVSRVELFNPETGEEHIIKGQRAFTLLPNGVRILNFTVPKEVKPGTYEVFAWIDYGSDDHIARTDIITVRIE